MDATTKHLSSQPPKSYRTQHYSTNNLLHKIITRTLQAYYQHVLLPLTKQRLKIHAPTHNDPTHTYIHKRM